MDNWPAHLATAHIERINTRLAAGWHTDATGIWHSPDSIDEDTWRMESWPLPEDPDFAAWFEATYHYEALDTEQQANPYPCAPPGFERPKKNPGAQPGSANKSIPVTQEGEQEQTKSSDTP